MPLNYKFYAASDIGLIRTRNEDSFLLNPENHTFAVADGLGGLPGGDLASQTAVSSLEQRIVQIQNSEAPNFKEIFERVNSAVKDAGKLLEGSEFGIATTLTAAKLVKDTLHVGHTGDSSIFLIRGDEVLHLTTEQTMAHDMEEKSPEGTNIPAHYEHILTHCLGHKAGLLVETKEIPIKSGDKLIITTDGISKPINMEEIKELSQNENSPESLVHKLIALANERGGKDNSTAIALFFE